MSIGVQITMSNNLPPLDLTRPRAVDASVDAWANDSTLQSFAHTILKTEMAKKGIPVKRLSSKLAAIGVHETPKNLGNKIRRGTFSFTFFLQCMRVLRPGEMRITLDFAGLNHVDALYPDDSSSGDRVAQIGRD